MNNDVIEELHTDFDLNDVHRTKMIYGIGINDELHISKQLAAAQIANLFMWSCLYLPLPLPPVFLPYLTIARILEQLRWSE